MKQERDSPLSQPPEKSSAKWTILFVTTLSAFMVALDSNIVTLALPKISHVFASGVSLLGWIITAYILTSAMLLLPAGKMGDRYGKKQVYLFGFALFGAASALCGLSQNIFELIVFRLLQGGAAAFLSSTSAPLIFESFPENQRGSAIGLNAVAWSVGAIGGPILGGIIVSLDWRLIFYVNVPIALVAVLIGSKAIPGGRKPSMGTKMDRGATDNDNKISGVNVVNSALLALTVAFMLLWLTFFEITYALAAVAFLGFLTFFEARSANPLLNKELRSNRGFVLSVISIATLQVAELGITFAMSFYFQSVLGYTPFIAGLSMAPLFLVLVVVGPVAGRLFDRIRTSAVIPLAGAVIEAVGTIVLSYEIYLGTSSPVITGLLMTTIGVGGALVWAPLIGSVLKFARPELRGLASGTAFTLINIGLAVSIAITIAASATFLPASVESQIFFGNLTNLSPPQIILFREGIARALLILGVVNFIAIPMLFLLMREQRKSF